MQEALPALLAHAPHFRTAVLARIRGNLQRLLASRPPGASWDVVLGHGGWSAVVRLAQHPGDEAAALALMEAGVAVQPGYFYGFPPAFLVVSLIPRPEDFQAAMPIFTRVLSALGR